MGEQASGARLDHTGPTAAEAALRESWDTERRFRELLAALHEVTLELATAPSFMDGSTSDTPVKCLTRWLWHPSL